MAVGLLMLTMPAVASLARPGAFNVTANTTNDYTPSYSPSGKEIAYRGSNPNRRGNEIYTIGVGGRGRAQSTSSRPNNSQRRPSTPPAWLTSSDKYERSGDRPRSSPLFTGVRGRLGFSEVRIALVQRVWGLGGSVPRGSVGPLRRPRVAPMQLDGVRAGLSAAPGTDVQQFDEDREAHREVDVALGDVVVEAFQE